MDPIEELKNDPAFQKWPPHRQELVLKAVQAKLAAAAPRLVPRGAGPSASEDVVMRPGTEVDREQSSWNNRFDSGMGMAALAALTATGGPLLAGAGASASGVLRGDSIPGAIAEGAITAAGGKYLPRIVKAGAPLIRAALSRGVPAAAETAAEVAVPAAESVAAAAPKVVPVAVPAAAPVAAQAAPAVAQAAPAVAEAAAPAASEQVALATQWYKQYLRSDPRTRAQMVEAIGGKAGLDKVKGILSQGVGDLMTGPPGTGAGTVPGGFYGTPIVKPAR